MISYGFFNSIDGDRKYNADQMSSYFEGLVSDGVYNGIGQSMVVLAAGLSVTVGSGRAIIGNKWIKNDSPFTVVLDPVHPTLARIDAIVIKLDTIAREVSITNVTGTPSQTPVEPTIQDSSTIKYLVLAYVYIGAAVTQIYQSDITDTRTDSEICGWVTGLIDQVDTSTLYLQWQDAFERWFRDLTEELNVDTYIQEYSKNEEVSAYTSSLSIDLDMTDYEYEAGDIIQVFINGLLAIPSVDYSLDTSGATAVIDMAGTYYPGTVVSIIVNKSIIGIQQN